MRAIYRLLVKQGLIIPVPSGTKPIVIKNTEVRWEADAENHLKEVVLVFSGWKIKRESKGTNVIPYPELEDEMYAYRLGAYIANSILIQTGFDAIDPEKVLLEAPDIFPETAEEEMRESASGMRTLDWKKCTINVLDPHGEFLPKEYPAGFGNSAAAANYADGLRVSSPILQYEQFYKVVEHFFKKKGGWNNATISRYASQYNPKYDEAQIKKLKDLRHRCIHPHPHLNQRHANSEDIKSIREVKAALTDMRNLALLLLHHPRK